MPRAADLEHPSSSRPTIAHSGPSNGSVGDTLPGEKGTGEKMDELSDEHTASWRDPSEEGTRAGAAKKEQ